MIPIVLKTEPTLVTKFARTTHDGRVARRDVTTGWAWWTIAAERPSFRKLVSKWVL